MPNQKANTIAIIDYGMGNLHSVSKAVEKVAPDARVLVTDKPEDILAADRVIFPGVGAIRHCMAEIKKLKLDKAILEVAGKKPMLAVCVGMQALMTFSEENDGVDCLNILPGKVKLFTGAAFKGEHKLKVPHMGWNQVQQHSVNGKLHALWEGIEQNERCYFVHSYYIDADSPEQRVGSSNYALEFSSALASENIFAVQFHPEKSHRVGLQLLKNFSTWNGKA
jgi:glutamine amidotransferase